MVETRGAHILITGAMGVGKTTVGRLLAEEVDRPFHDSDETLATSTGEKGVDIALREGVDRLHEIELTIFLEMCRADTPAVIAAASSVVDHEKARVEMAKNITIWLTASDDVIAKRQTEGAHRRDMDSEERERLNRRRAPWLKSVSSITIETGEWTPSEVVAELTDRLAGEDW